MNRHAHKGPIERRKALEKIPLIAMSKAELDDTFDSLGSDIDLKILEESRKGKCKLIFAALVLQSPEQPDRLVMYVAEYGDGEGTRMVDAFARRLVRLKLLRPEEQISIGLYECHL